MTAFSTPQQVLDRIKARDIATVRSMKASQHFTWGELLSLDTANINREDDYAELRAHLTEPLGIKRLENLARLAALAEVERKRLWGKPWTVTSALRTPQHQARVSTATASQHPRGRAMDVKVKGMTPKQVQAKLDPTWDGGLGYGSTFTHLDIRGFRARFGY